jgi:hypothetical protein
MENKSLHVLPLTGKWIVEKDDGTSVGESSEREEAIALAKDSAVKEGASQIAIHTEDGQVQKTIAVGE